MRFVLRAGATWLVYKLAEEFFAKRPTVGDGSEPGSEAVEPSPEPSQTDLDRVEEMYEDSAIELAEQVGQPGDSPAPAGNDWPDVPSSTETEDRDRDREKNLPSD